MVISRLSIGTKLIIMSILIVLAAGGMTVLYYNLYYDIALKGKLEAIKRASADGEKVAAYFYKLQQEGLITKEHAQEEALTIIHSLHDEDVEYLWVNTYDGVMVWHPNTKLIGRNLIDLTDKNGTHLFRRFTEVASNGGGFVRYLWPKPSMPDQVEKVSFISGFSPWNWVIGTGVYIDDINNDRTKYINMPIMMIVVTVFLLLFIIVMHWIFFAGQLRTLRASLTKLADGELYISDTHVHRRTEFSVIWEALSLVRNYIGSLERKYLEHEVEKAAEKSVSDKAILELLSHCEKSVQCSKVSLNSLLSSVHDISTSLNANIDKSQQVAGQYANRLSDMQKYFAETHKNIERCNAIVLICAENICELRSRIVSIHDIAQNLGAIASRFSHGIDDDLQQAITLMQSAEGHIRLIDVAFTELVMTRKDDAGQKYYLATTTETKSILQRLAEAVERLKYRREKYILDIPYIESAEKLRANCDLDVGIVNSLESNLKIINDNLMIFGNCGSTEFVQGFDIETNTGKMLQHAARQNSELIKVVMKITSIARIFDDVFTNVSTTIERLRNYRQKII